MERRGVILLSGGLDSATTLAIARDEGYVCYALTVRYGQRHVWEIGCATRIASALQAETHRILDLDLAGFGGSSLLGEGEIPREPEMAGERNTEMASAGVRGIPSTYVPARNTILLSLALAWAEVLESDAIFIGANAVDYSGYPDCRPEYLEAYARMADLATRAGVEQGVRLRIHAPLLRLSKAEIVARGMALGLDYGMTSSCYDPAADGAACGRCESCILRLKGFAEAGLPDPARYQAAHA
jgi:7-cyano-7-deazaguanine synthase